MISIVQITISLHVQLMVSRQFRIALTMMAYLYYLVSPIHLGTIGVGMKAIEIQ